MRNKTKKTSIIILMIAMVLAAASTSCSKKNPKSDTSASPTNTVEATNTPTEEAITSMPTETPTEETPPENIVSFELGKDEAGNDEVYMIVSEAEVKERDNGECYVVVDEVEITVIKKNGKIVVLDETIRAAVIEQSKVVTDEPANTEEPTTTDDPETTDEPTTTNSPEASVSPTSIPTKAPVITVVIETDDAGTVVVATPSPTKIPTKSATATVTPTNKPTNTVAPTNTVKPTNTPTKSATNTPTNTPIPTRVATSTPTKAPTSTPKPTATSTPKPTATSTPKPTATPTPTVEISEYIILVPKGVTGAVAMVSNRGTLFYYYFTKEDGSIDYDYIYKQSGYKKEWVEGDILLGYSLESIFIGCCANIGESYGNGGTLYVGYEELRLPNDIDHINVYSWEGKEYVEYSLDGYAWRNGYKVIGYKYSNGTTKYISTERARRWTYQEAYDYQNPTGDKTWQYP